MFYKLVTQSSDSQAVLFQMAPIFGLLAGSQPVESSFDLKDRYLVDAMNGCFYLGDFDLSFSGERVLTCSISCPVGKGASRYVIETDSNTYLLDSTSVVIDLCQPFPQFDGRQVEIFSTCSPGRSSVDPLERILNLFKAYKPTDERAQEFHQKVIDLFNRFPIVLAKFFLNISSEPAVFSMQLAQFLANHPEHRSLFTSGDGYAISKFFFNAPLERILNLFKAYKPTDERAQEFHQKVIDLFNRFPIVLAKFFLNISSEPAVFSMQLAQFLANHPEHRSLFTSGDGYAISKFFFNAPPHLRATYLAFAEEAEKKDVWLNSMVEARVQQSYARIYELIAKVTLDAIRLRLSNSPSSQKVHVYSMACGMGHDTWKVLDMLCEDMKRQPGLYKGRKIVFLLTDQSAGLISKAKALLKEKQLPDGVKVQIMSPFNMTVKQPTLKDRAPHVISASGFLNLEVTTLKEADEILRWAVNNMASDGKLILTGMTSLHFSRATLTKYGLVVEKISDPSFIMSNDGRGYRGQFYVCSKGVIEGS